MKTSRQRLFNNDSFRRKPATKDDDPASNAKKDIVLETADIGGFTLIFQNSETEQQWQTTNLLRKMAMTQRFLAMSVIFQGLFLWSDVIERHHENISLNLALRSLIGLMPLLALFLISTGLLYPSQMLLFLLKIFYGGPTLALYYFSRPQPSHWDFLYLAYGLAFFSLPRISPLNFIYVFSGTAFFTVCYIYISAFRLSFEEWFLSSLFLMIIILLFMYISYTSERSSRERFLLRQRLLREHINIQMVASSIEEDLRKTAKDRRNFPMNVTSRSPTQEERHKTMVLFYKGMAGWGLCMLMGYAFDAFSATSDGPWKEISSSAPFVLLMHSTGFSIFLMYYTGQLRWFVLNGVAGLIIIWLLTKTGMDNKWIVFSTHSVGYVVLAAVVMIMILVFGGVVLVWTHLIDFIKEILNRYPQVKDDFSQNKVLQQVLVGYISQLPSWRIQEVQGYDEEAGTPPEDTRNAEQGRDHHLLRVLDARKANACFFCHKSHPQYLLPACSGWQPAAETDSAIPMCTPYTEMAKARDDAIMKCKKVTEENKRLSAQCLDTSEKVEFLEHETASLRDEINNMNSRVKARELQLQDQLVAAQKKRDADIQSLIEQYNAHFSELRRLHKMSMADKAVKSAPRRITEASTTTNTTATTTPALNSAAEEKRVLLAEKSTLVPTSKPVEVDKSSPSKLQQVELDFDTPIEHHCTDDTIAELDDDFTRFFDASMTDIQNFVNITFNTHFDVAVASPSSPIHVVKRSERMKYTSQLE